MKKVSLSVVINTKNEGKNIETCLKSVAQFAQEIIVCDMESSDNTVEIAKRYKAKVISTKDVGYMEPARAKAIKAASCDWIFIIDADEKVPLTLQKKILQLINTSKVDVVRFPRKNSMFGKWVKHGVRWPDYQTRLFRNGMITWPKTIHAQPVIKGVVFNLAPVSKNAILHKHTTDMAHLIEKTWQQARKENFYSVRKKPSIKTIEERISHEVAWRFFEHEGYKDGVEGYIAAKMMEVYRFWEFVAFWEKNKSKLRYSSLKVKELSSEQLKIKELQDELQRWKASKFFILYTLYQKYKSKYFHK